MNRLPLIVLAALLPAALVSNAFASEPKTRAQVIAEYEQSRADGSFWIDDSEAHPRRLARTRLAEREQRAQRAAQAPAERQASGRAGS